MAIWPFEAERNRPMITLPPTGIIREPTDAERANLLAILAKLRQAYEEACKPYAAELCRLEAMRP